LLVHAYFDDELDAAETASIQQHLRGCAECQALLADLQQTRAKLKSAPLERAPASLRTGIEALLDAEPVAASTRGRARAGWWSRPFWSGAIAGVGTAAAVASLILFVLMPAAAAPIVDHLVTAHLRSLKGRELIAVVSSEQHTVKPWFAGRADVAPIVADFAADGYPLAGGRADEVSGHRAAVLVYRHGAHVVNVFSWPAKSLALPRSTMRQGYRLLFWRIGDVAYCAVSDTGWSELSALKVLMDAQAATEQRGAPR
jgi:anti-sigma factor RsiW